MIRLLTKLFGVPEAGFRRWRAPWIRWFPAPHKHRLTTPHGTCWTILWVGKVKREWGFWHDGVFYPWRDYVYGKNSDIADKMQDCG
jgi:hypothetical protein